MKEDKNYLCRCEEVTREDLHQLLREKNGISMEEIKRLTRCTMGPCQGKTCRENIMKEIAGFKGIDVTEVEEPTYRAPIKPIKIGNVMRGDADE